MLPIPGFQIGYRRLRRYELHDVNDVNYFSCLVEIERAVLEIASNVFRYRINLALINLHPILIPDSGDFMFGVQGIRQ